MAASNEQIGAALQVLFNSMRFPPGVDAEKAIYGYMQALQGFPVEAIAHGIRKFLRGECDGVNPKFCPHPPELASIIRGTIRDRSSSPTGGRLYGYRAPKSKIVEPRCTKDWAAQLVAQGMHPHGSIWCPGDLGDRPDIGDLYAPDSEWKPPVKVGGD
jgi:hypothetical protein